DKTGYHRELERTYPDPNDREARTASLEEIINTAANYQQHSSEPTLRGFLDDLALGTRDSSDDKENQLQNNAIALMTMHSAKGLEFPYVYLVGMEEGILPHKRSLETEGDAIDEERRLCYVGVTRAQEQLTLSFALTRRKWGKPRETVPSRFLYEMTGQAENVRAKRSAVSGQRSAAS
ncbi:MAG: ATP-binding domain-containing protein, partial [Planctomycetes bacterium]|nr:ATP-binding domain-containing protein [Planctomycetota bacterium]